MKKRCRCFRLFILAVMLLIGLMFCLPAGGEESEPPEKPVLRLIQVPVYGSYANVEGKVVFPSGKNLNPDDYCVTLFLQIYPDGAYWVKPTYAQPSVALDWSGAFSLDYTTGNIDDQAVILHVLLIPSDCIPSTFPQTQGAALDYVRVDRDSGGTNTVTPPSALNHVKEPIPGDANIDGTVSILDLVEIIDCIVSGTPCASMSNANANASPDDVVDILDLVWVIDKIVGS